MVLFHFARKLPYVFLVACVVFGVLSGPLEAQGDDARQTPIVRVVNEWGPSVVNISTERVVLVRTHPFGGFYGNLFDEFTSQFGPSPVGAMKLNSLGSGVIVSEDGLIMTNAHVVNMASKVFVILSTGEQVEAVVVAAKPQDDLALIKIRPPARLRPVRLAQDVMIGETVIAIGDPFGLENSVSAGIVSGKNRKFRSGPRQEMVLDGLIQTDASINFGSSGGALLNLDGELVGVNLAIVQNAQGIGFAVPFSKIRQMLDEYASGKLEAPVKKTIQIPVRQNKGASVPQEPASGSSITIKVPVKEK